MLVKIIETENYKLEMDYEEIKAIHKNTDEWTVVTDMWEIQDLLMYKVNEQGHVEYPLNVEWIFNYYEKNKGFVSDSLDEILEEDRKEGGWRVG